MPHLMVGVMPWITTGVEPPASRVPMRAHGTLVSATYTGWNPRSEGFGKGTLFPLQGAVIPFAATRAERETTRDPRASLAERYPDDAAYTQAVSAAAAQMVAERLLLPQDAQRAVDLAAQDRLARLR
jgi:hypothetical protein